MSSTSPIALATGMESPPEPGDPHLPAGAARNLPASSDVPIPPAAPDVSHPSARGPPPLSADLLRGAEEIAGFMFGDRTERRQVYHLASEVRAEDRLPLFRLGATLCARKSTLLAWIAQREASGRAV
jgi:hypothetical protein